MLCRGIFTVAVLLFLAEIRLSLAGGCDVEETDRMCNGLEKDTVMDNLHTVFDWEDLKGPYIDLIFLIDQSQSVGELGVEQSLKEIKVILEYLTQSGLIFHHECFTRLGVVFFETVSLAIFDDVSSDRDFTSSIRMCNLQEDLIDNPLTDFKTQPNSRMFVGLSKVEQMLKASERNNSIKVIWLFSDGDYDKEVNYTVVLNRLKDKHVKFITTGIGEWFQCERHERTLQSISSSTRHYACGGNWTTFIKSSDFTEAKKELKARYVPARNDDDCNCSEECVCDLETMENECQDDDVMADYRQLRCDPPTDPPPTAETKIIVKTELPLDLWLIIVICVAGTLLIIGFIVTCIVLVKYRPKPKGPPLPPPPLIRKLRTQTGNIPDDHIYAEYASYAMLDQKPEKQEKLEQLYYKVDDLNFQMIQMEDFLAEDGEMEVDIIYQKVDNERNMKGWGGYLGMLRDKHKMKQISVSSTTNNRSAWTPGFKIPNKELKKVDELMATYNCQDDKATSFDIQGNSYDIAYNEVSDNHLYGYRSLGGDSMETLWAVKSGDYLIIALAPANLNRECELLVHEIYNYLNLLNESEYVKFDATKI